MKAGASSLNPYAASYIPLSRRGAADESNDYNLAAKDYKSQNESVWTRSHSENPTKSQDRSASQSYNAHSTNALLRAEASTVRGQAVHGGSSSQSPNEITDKLTTDEEYDMDFAYLQMTFPCMSDESLSEVYMVNKGDLEATVDMLNQLELVDGLPFCAGDSSETLPDSLDIDDVSESGTSGDGGAPLKLKNVAGEAGDSSSASAGSALTS